ERQPSPPRWPSDALAMTVAALALRFAVVAWGASRFPPAGDGEYYHIVAGRIARGLGYTWLWPDGAVTYAAHYPIGYPALIGMLYAAFGEKPVWAMVLNAVAGASIVYSVHRIASRFAGRWAVLTVAAIAAVHPTFVFYTPALMTEQISAALCIAAVALALSETRTRRSLVLTAIGVAVLIGIATLVRPQQLLFAPFLGVLLALRARVSLIGRTPERAWLRAVVLLALVTSVSLGVCLPWTLRNCERMGQCVFVSANAGWNLLIGTSPRGDGAWVSIDSIGVPSECRTVYAEAAKDTCFGEAALQRIKHEPTAWLALVPAKLKKTFDDVGAPGWYLNTSDWHHFDDRAKVALGSAEVIFQRVSVLFGLVGLMRIRGSGRPLRVAVVSLAIGCLFYTYAWASILLLCLAVASLGKRLLKEPLYLCLGFAYGSTALVHAVFFGGARYSIVVMPLMLAAMCRAWPNGWTNQSVQSLARPSS
ncbi:MAG TPA: glycosyltransferase family 39 protein, partial [Polyangiaceae bacterium]|nr:glycosyltransferase family 39 protein [Polyangiaceae bacterium]